MERESPERFRTENMHRRSVLEFPNYGSKPSEEEEELMRMYNFRTVLSKADAFQGVVAGATA